jgi:hypothetical protein
MSMRDCCRTASAEFCRQAAQFSALQATDYLDMRLGLRAVLSVKARKTPRALRDASVEV